MIEKIISAIDAPYINLPCGLATPALIMCVIYIVILQGFYWYGKEHNALKFKFTHLSQCSYGERNQFIISVAWYLLQIPICIILPSFLDDKNLILSIATIYLEYEPIIWSVVLLFLCTAALSKANKDRHILAANRYFQLIIVLSIGTGLLSGQLDYSLWQNHVVFTVAGMIYCALLLVDISTTISNDTTEYIYSVVSFNPVEKIDQLFPQHKSQAEYISRIIEYSSPEPFSICLSGEWGMGKTSVIQGVIDILQNKKDSQYAFIRINALELDNKKIALSYLMSQIREQLKAKGVYVGVESEYTEFAASIAGTITTSAIGTLLQKRLFQYTDDYRQQRDKLEEVIKRAFPKGKLIVIIDDIERCSKEVAKDYLFLIKEVASMSNCISIFITDYSVLHNLISENHKNDDGNPANTFLDKFFNYKIDLHEEDPESILRYYDKCFKEGTAVFDSIYELCTMSPSSWYHNAISKINTKIQNEETQASRTHLSNEGNSAIEKNIHELKQCRSILISRMQVPRNITKFYNIISSNSYRCHEQLLKAKSEDEKNAAKKYIESRNLRHVIYLLSFAQACMPGEYQQLVKKGATYIDEPVYGDSPIDNMDRRLLIELMECTVFGANSGMQSLTGYIRADIRNFINSFTKPNANLEQLINPFTTEEEKWIDAIDSGNANLISEKWDNMVRMVLQKVPGNESKITNQRRNEVFEKLLLFAKTQIQNGQWTHEKVFGLLDRENKIDRELSIGLGIMQTFWDQIHDYHVSKQEANTVLENMQFFVNHYSYARIGYMYRLAQYLIPIDNNNQTAKLQEILLNSTSKNSDNISIFLKKLSESITGITLSGKNWYDDYLLLANHIYKYLDNNGLMFDDVREEAELMMDSANELLCLESMTKWLQNIGNGNSSNRVTEADYGDIDSVLQYFEQVFSETDQSSVRDRDVEEQFADFFRLLQNEPNRITNINQIAILHNLVSHFVKLTGYHSMPYRRVLNHISIKLGQKNDLDKT